MNAGQVPVEVTIDTSQGYSVKFEDDGFLLFKGEYDDSTYPLVTATILTQEIYDKYIKVPFMMTFEKSVDGDGADKIVQCMEMSAVQ